MTYGVSHFNFSGALPALSPLFSYQNHTLNKPE